MSGDRQLDTAQWARHTEALGAARNGVVSHADFLEVTPTAPESLAVDVQLGRFWIEGRYYEVFSSPVTVALTTADSTDPRIDRVVVRRDMSTRDVVAAAVTGTPAPSPTVPALTQQSAGVWEESLAQVLVGANETTIVAGDITDERPFAGFRVPEVFTADDTWSNPDDGFKAIRVRVVGGGGEGGAGPSTGSGEASAGAGGSAGSYSESIIPAASLGSTETVTVGSGGTGGGGGAGTDGGQSSFGAHVTAPGGQGGAVLAASSNDNFDSGTSPGAAGTGQIAARGGPGGGPVRLPTNNTCQGGVGGDSFFGGGGTVSTNGAAGVDGVSPGAGGSGASARENSNANAGGDGADGLVIVGYIY